MSNESTRGKEPTMAENERIRLIGELYCDRLPAFLSWLLGYLPRDGEMAPSEIKRLREYIAAVSERVS